MMEWNKRNGKCESTRGNEREFGHQTRMVRRDTHENVQTLNAGLETIEILLFI